MSFLTVDQLGVDLDSFCLQMRCVLSMTMHGVVVVEISGIGVACFEMSFLVVSTGSLS